MTSSAARSTSPDAPGPVANRRRDTKRAPSCLDSMFPEIVADSPAMRRVLCLVTEFAETNIPVLLQGESGTGKEMIASAIHRLSSRRAEPFVSENCAAIPDGLLESELFGHEKGAFTGASSAREGLLERAHQGTLFLDEIGEMPTEQQTALLRALQEREIRRIGSARPMVVDFRLISATNRVLEELVHEGRFRADLFYRLQAATVHLPPLRERSEDVPALVEFFNVRYAKELDRTPLEFPPELLRGLSGYPWPGNIRELQGEVWRLMITARGRVHWDQISPRIRRRIDTRRHDGGGIRGRSLYEIERDAVTAAIHDALCLSEGNVTRAARILRMNRASLYRRMERYGIERPRALRASLEPPSRDTSRDTSRETTATQRPSAATPSTATTRPD